MFLILHPSCQEKGAKGTGMDCTGCADMHGRSHRCDMDCIAGVWRFDLLLLSGRVSE